jgi:PTH1 family peptidyl-tRNA hydrolase
MIKLIVGLGNPGQQYDRTRHNAGFWFLDGVITNYGVSWSYEGRFEGSVSNALIAKQKVVLLKPQTFMNLSGRAVGNLSRYFKFEPEEILVVHDELDFEPGVVRLKKGGGHAGHNGLRDIASNLSSKDFYRLRVGIGRPPGRQPVADYVLSAPSAQDRQLILEGFEPVYSVIDALVEGSFEKVMNQLHDKKSIAKQ